MIVGVPMFNIYPKPACHLLLTGDEIDVYDDYQGVVDDIVICRNTQRYNWRCTIEDTYRLVSVRCTAITGIYHPLSLGACCVCVYKKYKYSALLPDGECLQRIHYE